MQVKMILWIIILAFVLIVSTQNASEVPFWLFKTVHISLSYIILAAFAAGFFIELIFAVLKQRKMQEEIDELRLGVWENEEPSIFAEDSEEIEEPEEE